MAGFLSRLVTKICRVLTTRKTVDDDEVAPRRNEVRTFKVPNQYLLTTRTMDDEDAHGLKAVPNFQVPDEVEPEDVVDPAEMTTLESRLGSLIQHNTITRAPAFKVELFGALRSRLYDSNKNLIMATLTSINGLESAMGPAIEKSSKGIVSDIVKCIGENKKHMRESITSFNEQVIAPQEGICERVVDIKTRAQAIKCLTTFSEAMGTYFIFERMSQDNVLCAATTIIATIKLIGVLHKLVGSDIKAFLSDV
ncbi:protein MOR1 [Tanacetum coccineum]